MDSFCGSPFWDSNVTWNTNSPDFTPCFEKTVLVWIPSGFLCIFSILQIHSSFKLYQGRIPITILGALQEAIALVLIILNVIQFSFTFREIDDPLVELYPVDRAEPGIKAVTFALALILQIYTKRKGVHSSAVLFIFWFLTALCSLFEFQSTIRSLPLEDHYNNQKIYTIITLISYPLIVIELLLNFFSDKLPVSKLDDNDNISEKHVELSEKEPCPQFLSSFPNQFTYQWVYPLLWKGYKKALEFQDLWELNADDRSYSVVERFNKYWKPELQRVQKWNAANKELITSSASTQEKKEGSTKNKKLKKKIASVLPALIKANIGTFLVGASFRLVQDLLAFVSPQALDLLINHLEDSSEESWKGYLYMVVIYVAVMTQTLCATNYAHRNYLTGMRLRATLVEAVYQKSLLVSSAARKESTVGEIVNLMSVDSQRFNDVMLYLNSIWAAPMQIGIAVYFLWGQLGPSVLAGIVVLVLLIPVNIFVATKVKALKVEQMKNKDERVRLMNEVLSGIKVLKLYAWEPSFEDKVDEIRKKEIDVLRRTVFLDSFGIFVWFMAPFMVSLASFATYVLLDEKNILDANKAFVSLTLFNIMRQPMSVLPALVMQLVQTGVSLNRVNKFMNADEIDPEAVSHQHRDDGQVVRVEKGTFSWDETIGTPALRNINLSIKKGSLVAVVGSVGSGKSSLISAILGEMEKLSGTVNTTGSIAYVSQQAWIQNATLRDNILFGRRFDPVLYDKILEACALKPDLKILPDGDKTEIGEKGINLSGGQKQRISIARAAYNGADMYFLDDPLSAVDSHVGKHLFQKVIGPRGFLHKKTRIFVTHGITYLSQVDRIIVLKNGEISESGSFHELLHRKGDFADFLIQHASVEDLESADSSVVKQLEEVVGTKEEVFARQLSNNLSLRSRKGPPSLARTDSTWSMSSKMSSSFGDSAIHADSLAETEIEASKLIEVEKTETGSIKNDVYKHYIKSMSLKLVLTSVVAYIVMSGLSLYSSMWLSEWSTLPTVNGTQDIDKRNMYLGVYGGLGAGQAIAVFLANITMSLGCLKAATLLQKHMLSRILRSPMSFFDTTPLGRIVNRFSKDVDVTDNAFPQMLYIWMSSFFQVLSTLIVIGTGTPLFLVVVIPIGVIYIGVQKFYVSSSRQLKRLESVSRSPIFSHFSETLAGTPTIRAFKVQHQFLTGLEKNLDQNQSAYFPLMCTNRWLAILLESIGNLVVLFATLFALLSDTDGGSVGLSVSYALSITINLNWLVRVSLDIETNIVAVERIKEYGEVPQESAWEVQEQKPSPDWPEDGSITFKNYQSRYRDGLDLVLKGVTCRINPGEKVGIVGRTGAGKSSLTLGLFRIVEAAGGSIEIDEKDISQLGLHDVRGRLTVIPQDPVLFAGTLRLNLDPYGKYSDDSIWHALEYAHLKQLVLESSGGLDFIVSENGENFSVGQRQLVCLARALLRKTKILVLDEATAAVDLETDDLIQKTIRSEFKECTVLTIAHRLNTIMDCNRIMVLDKGEISEFDSPENLLKDRSTIFYSMAKDAGLAPT